MSEDNNKPKRGRGRPKGSKNRPNSEKKQIENMLLAKKIVEEGDVVKAYSKHMKEKGLKGSPDYAVANCHRVLSKEVKDLVREYLGMDAIADVTRDTLVKLYQLIVAKFIQGDDKIKASDFIKTLDSLSRLVPDFKDRHELDDISKKSEEDIDSEIDMLVQKFSRKPEVLPDEESST